jgi:putative transposase
VDDYSRECVGQIADVSISGLRVTRCFDALAKQSGLPTVIVCDNGPEFTGKAMFLWATQRGINLHFIQPGKPTQNAFVENFNGEVRDQCLNLHWFRDLDDARKTIEA